VPLIPGFNMSEENMRRTAELVVELGQAIRSVDLLPYHALGRNKYQALGRSYLWKEHEAPTDAEVEAMAAIIRSYSLKVQIGG
jgi:pyruvate formate lyase activating enzyme